MQLEAAKEQRRAAWGKVGVLFYSTEMALQARAADLKEKLSVLPQAPKDLVAAEATLKAVKQDLKALEESRKEVTGRVMKAVSRIMEPEKEVQAGIELFEAEIIKVKKIDAAEKLKNEQKQKELNSVAEKVRLYIANTNAEWLRYHAKLISDSYIAALNGIPDKMPAIPPANIATYLAKVKARISIDTRTMPAPTIAAIVNTQADIDAEIAKHFSPTPPQEYVDGFAADLDLKYSDYELAWNNKEQALKINEAEAAENALAIDQQQSADVATAGFQAMAITVSQTTTKPLKEVYVLDLPETLDSAKKIIKAYMTNTAKCDPELTRVTKWFTGFGIKQMMTALEKVKNDDINFEVTGLAWKTQDKL